MKHTYKILALTLPVSIDALTKALALSALPGRDIVLIKGVLSLRLLRNTGAAFSLFADVPWLSAALSAVLLLGLLVYCLTAKMGKLMRASLLAILSGGLSNLIDRLINGAVTDMISLDFINFPVFNAADIFITVGALAVALCCIFQRGEG